jgi:hypothetical protein
VSGERAALPDAGADVARNRALWTIVNAQFTERDASRAWAADEVTWGLFGIPTATWAPWATSVVWT